MVRRKTTSKVKKTLKKTAYSFPAMPFLIIVFAAVLGWLVGRFIIAGFFK